MVSNTSQCCWQDVIKMGTAAGEVNRKGRDAGSSERALDELGCSWQLMLVGVTTRSPRVGRATSGKVCVKAGMLRPRLRGFGHRSLDSGALRRQRRQYSLSDLL